MQRPFIFSTLCLGILLSGCDFETVEEQPTNPDDAKRWATLGTWAIDTLALGSQFRFGHPSEENLAEQRVLTALANSLSQVTGTHIRLQHHPENTGTVTSCDRGSFTVTGKASPANYSWQTSGTLNTLTSQRRQVTFDGCVQGDWQIDGNLSVSNNWIYNYFQVKAFSTNVNDIDSHLTLTQLSSLDQLQLVIEQGKSQPDGDDNSQIVSLSNSSRVTIATNGQNDKQMNLAYLPAWNWPHLQYQIGSSVVRGGRLDLSDQQGNRMALKVSNYQLTYQLNQQGTQALAWSSANWAAVKK